MDKQTKTWLSIIGVVLVVLVMLGAAAIGGSIYLVSSHIRQTPAEETQAGDRFAQARQGLAHREPLVEIRDRDEVVIHHSQASSTVSAGAKLTTLRAMVYDPRDERIVDVDIPFWLLRIMPSGGRFSFLDDRGIDFDSARTRLTVEDLERHGPGLVLDHHDPKGARILVWTE